MSNEENPILKLKEHELVDPRGKLSFERKSENLVFSDPRAMTFKAEEAKQALINNRMLSDPKLDRFMTDFYAFGHDAVTAWSCEGHLDRTPIETPYIMFYCTEMGKRMIEGCFDIMNEGLGKRGIPVTPNRLTNTVRVATIGSGSIANTKVLIWAYDFNELTEPTEQLKAAVLTELYDAFAKGYAYP